MDCLPPGSKRIKFLMKLRKSYLFFFNNMVRMGISTKLYTNEKVRDMKGRSQSIFPHFLSFTIEI